MQNPNPRQSTNRGRNSTGAPEEEVDETGINRFHSDSLVSSEFDLRSTNGINMSILIDPAIADRVRLIEQVHSSTAAIKLITVLIFIGLLHIRKIGYVEVNYT